MNEQLFIQWLKQLPRVGQLSKDQLNRGQKMAEDAAKGEQTEKDGITIKLFGLTAAATGINKLSGEFDKLTTAASGL